MKNHVTNTGGQAVAEVPAATNKPQFRKRDGEIDINESNAYLAEPTTEDVIAELDHILTGGEIGDTIDAEWIWHKKCLHKAIQLVKGAA